jgi:hypothetical protein
MADKRQTRDERRAQIESSDHPTALGDPGCHWRQAHRDRSWPTRHRGPLAIHAGATQGAAKRQAAIAAGLDPDELRLGCVLGVVDVVDCLPTDDIVTRISARERSFGDFAPGRFGWVLENPRPLHRPLPLVGKLSIWELGTQDRARIAE